MKLFTKSAFKQALFCPASLYYYYDQEHYANQMNEDDFLQALAEGGQQAGDLAKVYCGVTCDCDIDVLDYEKALEWTADLLKREEVTIAEAAFRWKNCFVRADIIEKKGKQINLIEVKAKSWDEGEDSFWGGGKKPNNTVNKDFREYVYDVAFQKYVIQKALGPDFTVNAFLMLADKTAVSDAPDGVNQFFRVEKTKDPDGKRGRVRIDRKAGAEALRGYKHVLKRIPVDDICQCIIDGQTDEQESYMAGYRFKEFVDRLSDLYVNHQQVETIQVKGDCFKCPFYSNEKTGGKLDGRKECWRKAGIGRDQSARPMVGELWCGLCGGRSLKDELVKKDKLFLDQVTEEDIKPKTSNTQYAGLSPLERRMLQIGLATGNDGLLSPFKPHLHDGVYLDIEGLKKLMRPDDPEKGWRFPLHMIDFETTAVALPFYQGRRPYEQVAFQFSHHIIYEDGRIKHAGQYINTEKHHFPNFDFVRKLKCQLEKDNGTIFRYATHENTILRAIRKQLDESGVEDKQELTDFIDSITYVGKGDKKIHGPRDMVDLLEVVRGYYYHPDMKGSNSIKAVLPAILNSSKAIQEKYSKPIYGTEIPSLNYKDGETVTWIRLGPDGKVVNPYKELKPIAEFLGVSEDELERYDRESSEKEVEDKSSIANGGAALAAYTKLQFSDEKMTEALKNALLRYCELDTMSMVFIWEYLKEMCCGA